MASMTQERDAQTKASNLPSSSAETSAAIKTADELSVFAKESEDKARAFQELTDAWATGPPQTSWTYPPERENSFAYGDNLTSV